HSRTTNEPQYLKNLPKAVGETNVPTGEDKKNPPLEVKVKPSFKRTDAWRDGKMYYNETVELADDYYDSIEKYGVKTTADVKFPHIIGMKEVSYKATEVHEDYTNSYDVAVTFDRRYLEKVMNRLSFFHFTNLKKYLPLLKSREEFLEENWL